MQLHLFELSRLGCAVLLIALIGPSPAFASVQISTKATQNMNCSQGVCTPTAKKAVLNIGDLANMLAAGDVAVQSESLARDIEIDAALSWDSSSRLTLDSYRAITFKKPISVTGTGALTITTNDGGSGGDYSFLAKGQVDFWEVTGDSRLVINGVGYQLAKSLRQIAKAAKQIVGIKIALAKDIGASGTTYNAAPITRLSGSLEGLGHRVSDLTISSNMDGASLGLIGTYSADNRTDSARDITIANATVVGSGFGQSAGIFAGSGGPLLNIQVTGSVTLSGMRSMAGGILGGSSSTLTRMGANVAVSVDTQGTAGGLVGAIAGTDFGAGVISESYAIGQVSGGDGAEVGGLVGDNLSGTVSESYALGAVSGGNSSFVGGLIGRNEDANTFPRIDQAYSIGAVSGGSGATLGGLIGSDVADSSITNAYWDLDTSGIGNPAQGAGNISNDHGITGLTDAQLKSGLPAGFDPKIWGQSATLNNGYPYLIANPP